MRRVSLIIFCLSVFVTIFSSCGEMLTAMSNYNSSGGAQCLTVSGTFHGYKDGRWQLDVAKEEDTEWVKSKFDYYLNLGDFKTYYLTSSVTGAEYKISIYCKKFQQNTRTNYRTYNGVR